MRANRTAKGKSAHWCEVDIQSKDECSRRDRAIQGATCCKGIQIKGRN